MSATKGNTALALTRVWHHTSAQNRVLGTLASRIAWVLMGKHKPTYDPAVDAGDYVIVSDALQVRLTGKKATDKVYYHHTGFMGGLKEVPITRLRERRPEEIIRKAVSGMLPKNTFRDRRLERLKIFPGDAPETYKGNVLTTWRESSPKVERSSSASSVPQTEA
ncbi:ribosomal protein L13 [Cryptococcus neoformans var. grubii Br795]|nr:ribosomal protein L13 [Cryptococcus neoformans var. grubii MW-RSA36]OXG87517.1 ribosomal protein L13 [Cryptococcus neoformans var. grubii Br795]OXG91218.1 ribosomal protein L13 [Cryptococcus neoformans var. grubii D17-1]OXG98613.1 ribosomal protein L13 [Cryptococcus neoformans var. grubii A2-102-5]OXL10278.1 ribosomal protein L13 [Cryptococcus neoformans var. grubii Gb118]